MNFESQEEELRLAKDTVNEQKELEDMIAEETKAEREELQSKVEKEIKQRETVEAELSTLKEEKASEQQPLPEHEPIAPTTPLANNEQVDRFPANERIDASPVAVPSSIIKIADAPTPAPTQQVTDKTPSHASSLSDIDEEMNTMENETPSDNEQPLESSQEKSPSKKRRATRQLDEEDEESNRMTKRQESPPKATNPSKKLTNIPILAPPSRLPIATPSRSRRAASGVSTYNMNKLSKQSVSPTKTHTNQPAQTPSHAQNKIVKATPSRARTQMSPVKKGKARAADKKKK